MGVDEVLEGFLIDSDDSVSFGCNNIIFQVLHTGIVAICSNARSRQALLINRSLRASSSWAKCDVEAVSLTNPLGSWNKLVGP